MLKWLAKGIDTFSEWTGRIVALTVYVGIAVLVYEVTMRYVFNTPTIWAHGVSLRLFAMYYIVGGGFVSLHHEHVRMDLLYARLSPRGQAIIELVTALLFFAFCGVMLWKGYTLASNSIRLGEFDRTAWRAPIWPAKLFIPIGALFILLQGIVSYGRDLVTAITGRRSEP